MKALSVHLTPPTLENCEPPHPAPTIAIASKFNPLNNEVSTLRNNSDLESEPFHHGFKRNRKVCLYGEEIWAILILHFDNGGGWSGLPKTWWEQTWGGVPWICYGCVDDSFFVEESGSGATASEIFNLGLQNLSGKIFWLPVLDPGSLESWVMGWIRVGKSRCVSSSAGQAMDSGIWNFQWCMKDEVWNCDRLLDLIFVDREGIWSAPLLNIASPGGSLNLPHMCFLYLL